MPTSKLKITGSEKATDLKSDSDIVEIDVSATLQIHIDEVEPFSDKMVQLIKKHDHQTK
ncbi:MAG: hypothetical protein GY920_22410 [Aliivibrio sp.]|nr:hypothetical protein [Aliivibrio sp.]